MTFLIFWRSLFFSRSKTIPWPSTSELLTFPKDISSNLNSPIWNDLIWQRTKIPINFILIDSTVWCLEKLMTQRKSDKNVFRSEGNCKTFSGCAPNRQTSATSCNKHQEKIVRYAAIYSEQSLKKFQWIKKPFLLFI